MILSLCQDDFPHGPFPFVASVSERSAGLLLRFSRRRKCRRRETPIQQNHGEKRLSPGGACAGIARSLLPILRGQPRLRRTTPYDFRKTLLAYRRREAAINQRSARRLALAPFSETHFLMLAREAVLEPASAGVVWSHGAAPAQEYRLRLKQTTPNASRRYPLFKSSTASPDALAPSPLCAVLKRKLTFPFWKEKLRLAHFFSPKRNPKIPGEKGRKKATWLSRNGDIHLTKRLRKHAYYYEHQSHHHHR